jgi:hypothetical protein
LRDGSSGEVIAVAPDPARLGELAELVATGELVARVGEIVPLAAVRHAHALSITAGGTKIVLRP